MSDRPEEQFPEIVSADYLAKAEAEIARLRADNERLREALVRADRLINWMSGYVGKIDPRNYYNCFADLNEHFLFMESFARALAEKDKPDA